MEEFNQEMEAMELWEVLTLFSYMSDHPETGRIEYKGEMLTLDELIPIRDELEAVIYS